MSIMGFVYVIESPAPRDLLDGRTEGRVLTEALRLAEIPHWYSLAADKATMLTALGERLSAAQSYLRLAPILHLSMHGDYNGVQLTSGEFIAWHDLRLMLLPWLRAMQGGLLVCMSSCFGSSGCRMAMYEDDEPPFWALVGNCQSATWADAAIAYMSFYHRFFKGAFLHDCVEAMKAASGDMYFQYHMGASTRSNWADFLRQNSPQFDGQVMAAADEPGYQGGSL